MSLTSAQQQAVEARGNVLVVAGAGTGKTSTLVERCLHCLLTEQPPAALDEILVVTFTEAAAAEMRQRLRARLEAELGKNPDDPRWPEQLALFETAHIGTLHGFCLQLVRQHFYELELDPQLTVLAEAEARLLAEETLDAVLQAHYAGRGELAEAVQLLIQTQGRGWDKPVRELVLKLHQHAQALPDPQAWFARQRALFDSPEPAQWRAWFHAAVAGWRKDWSAKLAHFEAANLTARECAAELEKISNTGSNGSPAGLLQTILAIRAACPPGKKGKWLDPLKEFFAETAFLQSLVQPDGGGDPLVEDWNWARPQLTALLRLAVEFREAFASAKRELGSLDFQDLEQHALRLLWEGDPARPSAVAQAWREKLRFVFVDEYQDINAAQDKIVEALSRDGAVANRFLVGDVKQSIYRFRLANPRIFQNYAATWSDTRGTTIALTDNFRSREGLLAFINDFFSLVMRGGTGGVVYDEAAALRFGERDKRQALSRAPETEPRVELHLLLKGSGAENEEEISGELSGVADLDSAGKEARLVALRLRELKRQRHQVWNEGAKKFRTAEWSDMAVLLRAPGNKAESFAREFARLGVPLAVARGGFYESLEISDLLSLLQLLDNPLQDVPVLAVLRSPLVGLSIRELAAIRLAATKVPFWTALQRWREQAKSEKSGADTLQKVENFLSRFARWRRLARQASLSRCLETVLAETHYSDWLLTQPRGAQRRANVQRLLGLTRQFDQFQRQGLFRFLRFIAAQQAAELEPEVASAGVENAVRLMSIHQSKGLEFPVVALPDLAKPFNFSDTRAEIILDEEFGLCPQIKPPHTGRRYPSLAHWLAGRRQKLETLGEELRLLYVAMTRARDTLILTATVPEKKFETDWKGAGANPVEELSAARNAAHWLGLWFAKNCAENPSASSSLLRWEIHEDGDLAATDAAAPVETDLEDFTGADDRTVWEKLQHRLAWQYPFTVATVQPAKTSVSALRRRAAEQLEEEAQELFPSKFQIASSSISGASAKQSAADIGTAHHKFLQFVSLERTGSVAELRVEAERLQNATLLSAEEIGVLDFAALTAFWRSPLGKRIRKEAHNVRRELAFTARFDAAELAALTGATAKPPMTDEFVVVQGVADLAVILETEIWLLDFKTDEVVASELAAKVKGYEPQLRLYARALARIYRRPVTEAALHFLAARTSVPLTLD